MHKNAFGGRALPGTDGEAYSAKRSSRSPSLVKGERKGRGVAEWEKGRAGASRGTPGDVKCVTEILRWIRKLGEQSLNLVS